MGALDDQGIHIYTEDDPSAPFSDTLNLLAESTSAAFANDRARLGALEGLGVRSVWVPTFTNATVGNGIVTAYYTKIGDTVSWQWEWVFGSTSAISGTFATTLPTLVQGSSWIYPGGGFASRGNTQPEVLAGRMSGSTTMNLYHNTGAINATAPFTVTTWTTDDVISVGGVYFAP